MKAATFTAKFSSGMQGYSARQVQQFGSGWTKFRELFDIKDDDDIDQWFESSKWPEVLSDFKSKALGAGIKEKTFDSYQSYLKTLRSYFVTSYAVESILEKNTFAGAISLIRQGRSPFLSQDDIVMQLHSAGVEISVNSYKRLESGERWPKSRKEVMELEKIFAIPLGSLQKKCLQYYMGTPPKSEPKYDENFEFEYIKTLVYDEFNSPLVIREISSYLKYKSAALSTLQFKDVSRELTKEHGEGGTQNVEDRLLSYLAYLCLPKVPASINCGEGLDINSIKVTDFFNPDYLDGYKNFLSRRSKAMKRKGDVTTRYTGLLITLEEMCSPKSWLEQYKILMDGELGIVEENWEQLARRHYKWLLTKRKEEGKKVKKVFDRLGSIKCLDDDRPIGKLIELIEALEQDIHLLAKRPEEELRNLRQRLIASQTFYAIETIFPLRYSHLMEFAKLSDLKLCVDEDGAFFELQTRREDYKNQKNEKDVPENQAIPMRLIDREFSIDFVKIFNRYLDEARAELLVTAHESQKQVATRKAKKLADGKQKKKKKQKQPPPIDERLFPLKIDGTYLAALTYRYLGTRWTVHCNRHIVATDRIKFAIKLGIEGFTWAAELLVDSIQTVKKAYGRFGAGDYLKAVSKVVGTVKPGQENRPQLASTKKSA